MSKDIIKAYVVVVKICRGSIPPLWVEERTFYNADEAIYYHRDLEQKGVNAIIL